MFESWAISYLYPVVHGNQAGTGWAIQILQWRTRTNVFPLFQWSTYSPKMTQALLAGLLRHIHATAVEEPPNFLQKSDPRFKKLHNAITNLYCKLQGQGIGIQTSLWKVTNWFSFCVTFHKIYHWTNQEITRICKLYHAIAMASGCKRTYIRIYDSTYYTCAWH